MQASRRDWRRSIDFSAVNAPYVSLSAAILTLLRRRQNPMREREIAKWFFATPPAFISATLGDMLYAGAIQAGRTSLSRNRRVLEYYIEQQGAK